MGSGLGLWGAPELSRVGELLGIWAVYVWYCAVRAVSFAGLGGLLRGPRDAAPVAEGGVC